MAHVASTRKMSKLTCSENCSNLKFKNKIEDLKDPSQPQPFLMPSKLLILHGEVKSYYLTVSCVLETMIDYF